MLKKTIASLVVGGALLGGVASAGTAYAAAPTATAAASSTSTAGHPLLKWLKAHRREIRKAGIELSAKTIGVTPKALVTELRTGKSVAQVAGEHGVSTQTVVNALVGAADTKVDQAVTSGKLNSSEAAKIKAALPGYITKAVNRTR